MQKLTLYQIDAFAEKPFSGNPAAVVLLDRWMETQTMQNIAFENNLSETAFLVKSNDVYEVRYFTPTIEVDLCGHATLASAYVLFELEGYSNKIIIFRTQNRGDLFVNKSNDIFMLDFPTDSFKEAKLQEELQKALDIQPEECFAGLNDLLLVYQSEDQIRKLTPNFELLKKSNARGIMITAKGNEVDFVSRFFAPASGINEDPVTGSAHTTLIPYWYGKLGKKQMTAQQLSARGGTIYCEFAGDRVKIGGKAIHYLTGTIII